MSDHVDNQSRLLTMGCIILSVAGQASEEIVANWVKRLSWVPEECQRANVHDAEDAILHLAERIKAARTKARLGGIPT